MARESSPNGQDSFYNDSFQQQQENSFGEQDWSNVPKDLPMPWSISSSEKIHRLLAAKAAMEIKTAEKVAGRKLTAAEQESITYWSAKDTQIQSRGLPLGILGGLSVAYNTRKQYRFPFYKPGEGFNPNLVKIGSIIIAEGARARFFWHFNRVLLYGFFFGPLLGIISCGFLGTFSAAAGRFKDPRMKDLVANTMRMRNEMTQRVQQARAEREMESRSRYPAQVSSPGKDEYSPVNGDRTGSIDPYRSQQADNYLQQDSANPASQENRTDSASSAPGFAKQSWPSQLPDEQPQRENQGSGFFDNDDKYDDASPIATNLPQKRSQKGAQSHQPSRSSPPPSNDGGSAWDRLRSGGSPSSGNSQSSGRARNFSSNNSSSGRESGSYSKADEDTQLARSQAQKDFDASLERERQGKNFD